MFLVYESQDPDESTEAESGLAGVNLLLATANAGDGEGIASAASAAGMQVTCAEDAGGAWFLASSCNADVVVVDADLPGGGHAFAGRLAQLRHAPVVVLLTHGVLDATAERELKDQCGVQLVQARPFSVHELLARIRTHLEGATWGARRRSGVALPPPPAPALKGPNSLEAQAALLVHLFAEHRDGVLRVECGGVMRKLYFHDGLLVATSSSHPDERLGAWLQSQGLITESQLVDALHMVATRGGRLGYAMARHLDVSPVRVAQSVLDQLWWVATQAIVSSSGTHEFVPAEGNLVLSTQIPVDPLEAIQRACTGLLSETAAYERLSRLSGAVHWNPTGPQRLAGLSHTRASRLAAFLPPERPLSAILQARPPDGLALRELLGLLLCGAVELHQPGVARHSPVTRMPFNAVPVSWLPPADAAHTSRPDATATRNALAMEWLRTGGAEPHEILEVPPDAPSDRVRQAAAAKLRLVSDGVLTDATLGGTQRLLEVLRARVVEAAQQMARRAATPPAVVRMQPIQPPR